MEAKLMLGDCLERMKEIPTGSIDLVLCDLPYGTTENKWDSVLPLKALWNEYKRLSSLVVLTAQQPFTTLLINSNIDTFRYEWIWEKNVATGFMNAKKMPLKQHENVLVFYNTLPTYNPQYQPGKPYKQSRSGKVDTGENYGQVGIQQRTDTLNDGWRYPQTIIKCAREVGLHPTQKPVALMEYFIKTYTNEGDTVLDNTMGSGTTGVACVNTNRNFIGIERDPAYFEICKQRIPTGIVIEPKVVEPVETCLSHKLENCKRCNPYE